MITELTTNQDGLYDAVSILPGSYRITFSSQGFETLVRDGITLQVGTLTVNGQLTVGASQQQVEVTAEATLLKTETAEQSTTLESETLINLPDVGQFWANFTKVLPGAAGSGTGVAVNGNLPYYSNFMADGASTTLPHSANVDTSILETVAELHIQTSTYSAQYGIGGAAFNQISKGGTNAWHGSGYEYFKNDFLNARDFFAPGVATAMTHARQQSVALVRASGDNQPYAMLYYRAHVRSRKRTPKLTRRSLFPLIGGVPYLLAAQGMASRGVKPAPRGKPSGLPFLAHFTDVAESAGLRAPTIYGGVTRKDYIVETTGCGCAFFDYDNDGWLDVLVLCGTRFGDAPADATNRLYRNNRNGTFTDVTVKAGLTRTGWPCGVCVGDYDNDGFEDVFITYWDENVLYHNNGDGTFTDVTARAGVGRNRTRWGAGCTWVDYDRDGRLDLFVSNYIDFGLPRERKAGRGENCTFKGVAVNCGPRGLTPGLHSLYRNNGDGTFTDVTEAAGLAKIKGRYALTAVAADYDEDGWPDIFVACDSTPSLLLMNNHDGTFREEGMERGAALSDDGNEQAGMGVGIGDYDLDGHLDLFKGHFTDDTNTLYRNDGKGNFNDVTLAAGLGVETRFTGWGAGIVDLDNDGYPDLFLVTGNVYPEIEGKVPGYPYKTPRVIFRNLGGGKFEEIMSGAGPGIEAPHSSRGCAFGDFDNDGDLDVLIINLNEPPSLLRNDLQGDNHWLKVKLVGTKSNRSAIGARVVARYGGKQQAQEVISQSSYCSCNDRRLHFGLGAATAADLGIRWPSGARQNFAKVPANQVVMIREGAATVERWPGARL